MKHNEVKEFLQKNALTITLQLVGILVVFVNLWITTQLSPFANDISSLKKSVSAIEIRLEKDNEIHNEFISIKTTVREISDKIDKLDERLYNITRK